MPRCSFAKPNDEEPNPAFVMPTYHWTYQCVGRLNPFLPKELRLLPPLGPNRGVFWNRYDFAIFCTHIIQDGPKITDPTAKDIFYTLNREFAPELEKFGIAAPMPSDDYELMGFKNEAAKDGLPAK